MTLDLFVGFEEKPVGLKKFLQREGYAHVERPELGCVLYTRKNNPWPQVFYDEHLTQPQDDEVPNWHRAGFTVIAEVNINYPIDYEIIDEAERLSEALTKKFNGILYDPNLDDYFRASDL